MVIRVDRESLKVVDQLGNVRDMRPQELTPRKNAKTAVSLDRLRNNIKVGDAISFAEGMYKGKQGTILHLNRAVAFVLCPELQINQGVVNVTTKNIQLVGTSLKRESPGGFSMPAQRQAMTHAPNRRDPLLSKVVRVKAGPFKGHQGTVVAVNDDTVRIEIHSRPKPISVTRDKIVEIDNSRARPAPPPIYEGSRTPAYAGSQTPSYSGSRTPAYAGSQTPMYGSGSRTPAYEGGMTPGWEGGRTPAWDAGSRTPSSSYSSYHTPSWNNKYLFLHPGTSFFPLAHTFFFFFFLFSLLSFLFKLATSELQRFHQTLLHSLQAVTPVAPRRLLILRFSSSSILFPVFLRSFSHS